MFTVDDMNMYVNSTLLELYMMTSSPTHTYTHTVYTHPPRSTLTVELLVAVVPLAGDLLRGTFLTSTASFLAETLGDGEGLLSLAGVRAGVRD